MINKDIMEELKKLNPISTIYYHINKIKEDSNYQLTKEQAAYKYAGSLGIDITRYLSEFSRGRCWNWMKCQNEPS